MGKKILAVSTPYLNKVGSFQGIDEDESKFDLLCSHSLIVDRDVAETDDNYKQFIPYTIVSDGNGKYFAYRRGKSGGENRLHDLYSIGVGGHVDTVNTIESKQQIIDAQNREIKEEIGVYPKSSEFYCLLNDDSNAVGRVHLGVVYRATVDAVGEIEHTVEDHGFFTADEIRAMNLEGWSRILVESGALGQEKETKKKKKRD